MNGLIDLSKLKDFVTQIVNEALKNKKTDDLTGRTWNIDQFRKECCGGREKSWVRTFIFDEFPETNVENGGFVVNPRRTAKGSKTIIFAKRASEWMEQHQDEIDWNARLR